MKRMTVLVSSLFCLVILQGCGGSAAPQAASDAARGFQAEAVAYANQLSKFRNAPVTTAMPVTGRSTYNGRIGLSGNQGFERPDAIGSAQITADFAAATINGSMSGFVSASGASNAATLQLSNGIIAGNQIVADVSGDNPLGPQGTRLSGSVQGAFLGSDAAAVAGTLVGTSPSGVVYGRFVAER